MHQTQWSPERPLPSPVSLASQSHHEKPPEVTCTSRGPRGFHSSYAGGIHFSLPGSHFIILASGSFSCYSLGLLSNCSRELRVPLELQQVPWDSFRVVMKPPLELQWVRSSLVEICSLDPVYCNVREPPL